MHSWSEVVQRPMPGWRALFIVITAVLLGGAFGHDGLSALLTARGDEYLRSGYIDFARADRFYARAEWLAPEAPDAYERRAFLASRAETVNGYRACVYLANRGLARFLTNVDLRADRAWCLYHLGEVREAHADFVVLAEETHDPEIKYMEQVFARKLKGRG